MLNIKSGIKFVCIVSFVGTIVFSNSSDVLAANAVVTSDLGLNFNNNKLELSLTEISNKSGTNVVFYSNNSLSSNKIELPNGSTMNKATYLNDSFIGLIDSNNYITLFYNKDNINLNKGSFSVNVGADYRSVISKEYIKDQIVDPNIKKYLPQNPEAFIPVVAQLVVDRINAVNNWNNTVSNVLVLLTSLLVIISLYLLIKFLIVELTSWYERSKVRYEIVAKSLQDMQSIYSKVTIHDPYLRLNYEGKTKDRVDSLKNDLNKVILDKSYSNLLVIPTFKHCLFNTAMWVDYEFEVTSRVKDWTTLNKNITTFFEEIKGINSSDPLDELEKIEEEKKRQVKYKSLLDDADKTYKNVYEYIKDDEYITKLYNEVKDATTIEDRSNVLVTFNSEISKEIKLINDFNNRRNSATTAANYIINNNFDYPFGKINDAIKQCASHLLTEINSIKYNKSYDRQCTIVNLLNDFTKEYLIYDIALDKYEKEASKLINEKLRLGASINNLSNKFNTEKIALISKVNAVKFTFEDSKMFNKTVDKLLIELYKEYEVLKKKHDEYVSRKHISYKYSSYRNRELSQALDVNDYALFDSLIKHYKVQDTPSYSNSSSSSSSYNFSSSSSSYSDSSSSSSDYSDSSSSDSDW